MSTRRRRAATEEACCTEEVADPTAQPRCTKVLRLLQPLRAIVGASDATQLLGCVELFSRGCKKSTKGFEHLNKNAISIDKVDYEEVT